MTMDSTKDYEETYLGSVQVGHRQEGLHCLCGRWRCSPSNSGQDGEEGKA